jgi:protein required for attachment to host cells
LKIAATTLADEPKSISTEAELKNVRIPWGAWVVVCDGQKALFLHNDGDAELLNLKPVEVLAETHASTTELGTDKPGRTFQSHGPGRGAVEAPDYHTAAEVDFLRKVAAIIDTAASEGKTKHLVLIAPPKALGIVREALTPAARAIITAEIHKDLVHLPIGTIEAHLTAAE